MAPQQNFSMWDGWGGLLQSLLELTEHKSPMDLLPGIEHPFDCLVTHEDGYADVNFSPVF
ncbi:MAG: hypothetical protein M9944_06070 [Rhizobiaceae bacterium]|nr:hypothetical protein [Rhizobiaceae bacterium]